MTEITVLFFSLLRDATGVGEVAWPWPPRTGPATVSALLDELFAKWPSLAKWNDCLLVSVDLEYTRRDRVLEPGQEVALMPPVQGG